MGKRSFLLLVSAAVGLLVLGTRCSVGDCVGVQEGASCNESQVGLTCPDLAGCKSLVCDGVQFGPQIAAFGDSCTQAGLVCRSPGTSQCPDAVLTCDGTQFVMQGGVGPGAACSQAGVVCHWPDTECDTCTCDGTTFQCQQQNCTAFDGGAPPACPSPALVVAGQSCTGSLMCASAHGCDAGSLGMCSCTSGTWACQCVATPTVLAAGEHVSGIATDGAFVYWADYGGGLVKRIPVGGGTPATLASGQSGPTSIAIDSTSVYWLDTGSAGGVVKVGLGGGTPVVLASDPQPGGNDIAVDATNVYWTSDKSVKAVPIGGGTPITLATSSQLVTAIAINATNLYWSTTASVSKVPLSGGASLQLASPQGAMGLAVDATNLYWTDSSIVAAMPLAGGLTTTLASGQQGPYGIAVDASAVYWVDYGELVMKVPLTGGTPVILAFGQKQSARIAIDATNVFWGSAAGVMTTPK